MLWNREIVSAEDIFLMIANIWLLRRLDQVNFFFFKSSTESCLWTWRLSGVFGFGAGLLGFFVSQNDYLYLSSKSVKGAVVTSIEQCHCGFPLPLTSELCWFLQGLASFRVHCRCLPLMGCGSVSSAKLLATFCHYRVDHCLLKKHPLCTYSNLMLWDNGLGDLGTASKRKNQPKKTPNPEGYV